jgi:hypothetical protein
VYSSQNLRRSSNWLSLRLPDMRNGASFETGNPSCNGAIRNFEYIDAFDCRCDHTLAPRHFAVVFRFSLDQSPPTLEERHVQLQEGVYQMGSGFSRKFCTNAHCIGYMRRNGVKLPKQCSRSRKAGIEIVRKRCNCKHQCSEDMRRHFKRANIFWIPIIPWITRVL